MSNRGRFWFRASQKGEAHRLAMQFALTQGAMIRPGDLRVDPCTTAYGWWGMVALACPDDELLSALLRPDLIAYERVDQACGISRDYYLSAENDQDARRMAVEMIRQLNDVQVLTSFLTWPGAAGWVVVLTVAASDHDPVRSLHQKIQIGHGGRFGEARII